QGKPLKSKEDNRRGLGSYNERRVTTTTTTISSITTTTTTVTINDNATATGNNVKPCDAVIASTRSFLGRESYTGCFQEKKNPHVKNYRARARYYELQYKELAVEEKEEGKEEEEEKKKEKVCIRRRNVGTQVRWNVGTLERWNVGTLERWNELRWMQESSCWPFSTGLEGILQHNTRRDFKCRARACSKKERRKDKSKARFESSVPPTHWQLNIKE
ncbi:hypothetical protein V1478_000740, partial [Vespula squamosa]